MTALITSLHVIGDKGARYGTPNDSNRERYNTMAMVDKMNPYMPSTDEQINTKNLITLTEPTSDWLTNVKLETAVTAAITSNVVDARPARIAASPTTIPPTTAMV